MMLLNEAFTDELEINFDYNTQNRFINVFFPNHVAMYKRKTVVKQILLKSIWIHVIEFCHKMKLCI